MSPSPSYPLSRRVFAAGLTVGATALGVAKTAERRDDTTRPAAARMPVGFVSHGAPTLALDEVKGADLRRWASAMPKPSAVLVVSAHWQERGAVLGATRTVPLMYDFGGFPDELYRVTYEAPGAPDLAARVAALLAPTTPAQQRPDRALDHGAWVPLVHMYPSHDVPVLQLSLPALAPRALVAFGRALAPLRDEGVLVLGSGSMTHNLRRVGAEGQPPPAWAAEFDAWATEAIGRLDEDALSDYRARAPGASMSHPSEEHYLPLLVALGASEGTGRVGFPITGFEYGSLSRRSVQIG